LVQISAEEEAKELANTYAKMDPGAAAAALEKLENNLGLVCDVLLSMTEKNRAAIMDEMSADFAAKVTKKIYETTN
jgi:flagellar motility protein MotE (MotC chaperone)